MRRRLWDLLAVLGAARLAGLVLMALWRPVRARAARRAARRIIRAWGDTAGRQTPAQPPAQPDQEAPCR